MKRLISLILCLILMVLSSVFVSAVSSNKVINDGMTLEQREQKSVDANNDMINYFIDSAEETNRSDDFKVSDYYPVYYGGSYIDENGELVVLITEEDIKLNSNLSVVSEVADNPKILSCKYSYVELEKVIDDITLGVELTNKSGGKFAGQINCWAIDEEKNCVYVYLKELTNEVIKWFKANISDSDAIVFKQSNGSKGYTANLPGQEIIVVNGNAVYSQSAAFRVRRSTSDGYKYGFFTNAHYNSLGSVVYGQDSSQIGIIKLRRFGGAYDVSYVEMTNSNNFSNTISWTPYELRGSNEEIDFPVQGMSIYLYAKYSHGSFGRVMSTNVSALGEDGVMFSGLVGGSYSCVLGDSGGLICTGPTNITCDPVGVQCGYTEDYSVFTSAANIVNLWYLTCY